MEKQVEKDQSKKVELCKISNHNIPVVVLCTNPECTKIPFCCGKCMVVYHQKCGEHFIFLEDIFAKKPENLLAHSKFAELKKLTSLTQVDKNISLDLFKKEYTKSVIEELEKGKNSINVNINIVNEKAKSLDQVEQEKCLTGLFDTFHDGVTKGNPAASLIKFEELKEKVKEFVLSTEKSPEFDKKVKNYFKGYFEEINKKKDEVKTSFWTAIVDSYAKAQIHPATSKIESKFSGFLNSSTLTDSLFSKGIQWSWNPNKKHENLDLSEKNLVVVKKGEPDHTAVLGNTNFETGIHIWDIKCEGINNENWDWIQFGLIEEPNYPVDYNNSIKAFSIASGNYFGDQKNYRYNMEIEGPLVDFNEKTFRCEFDADAGIFTITGNGITAKNVSLKGKKNMFPFINLFHPGNKATLTVIQ